MFTSGGAHPRGLDWSSWGGRRGVGICELDGEAVLLTRRCIALGARRL